MVLGFQPVFENNAEIAIGTYVNINRGKVSVKKIFLNGVVLMCFHSVIVVIIPTTNNVKYILSSISPIEMTAIIMSSPMDAPQIPSVTFEITDSPDRINAGIIAMDISKHEKLP